MPEKHYTLPLTASRDEIAAAVEKLRGELAPAHIGAPKKEPTPFQLAALLALYPTANKRELAEKLGVSGDTMRRWWREYGEK